MEETSPEPHIEYSNSVLLTLEPEISPSVPPEYPSHHPNKASFLYLIEDECDGPSPLLEFSGFLVLRASLPSESHSSFLK